MKKVITSCLLVVTLSVGGMTLDAKTTKKKTKAKTTQSSKSGTDGASKLNYGTFFSGKGGIEFRNRRDIESALEKAGFKLKSSSTNYKFTCNGTRVEISGDGDYIDIDIFFKNKKTLDSFVAKMESSGFKYEITTASGIEYFSKGNIEMGVQFNQVWFSRN